MADNERTGTPCGVCGQDDPVRFRIWFDGHVKLYRCRDCGFVAQYLGPGVNKIITDDYRNVYIMEFSKTRDFKYPQRRPDLLDIMQHICKKKPGGRLLDVGCGDGQFLHLCRDTGLTCFGIEPSQALSEYARTKSNACIKTGFYKKEVFEEHAFDVVAFIQVLEHIPNPRALLDAARFHLKADGLLVIEVPSITAPNFLAYRLTRAKSFVAPPRGIIRSHCGYYSPRTLSKLAKQCGFTEDELITGRWSCKPAGLRHSAGKVLDPLLNLARIGGILYFGHPRD